MKGECRAWTSHTTAVHAVDADGKDGHWQRAICGKLVSALGVQELAGDYTPGAKVTCKTCRRVLDAGNAKMVDK